VNEIDPAGAANLRRSPVVVVMLDKPVVRSHARYLSLPAGAHVRRESPRGLRPGRPPLSGAPPPPARPGVSPLRNGSEMEPGPLRGRDPTQVADGNMSGFVPSAAAPWPPAGSRTATRLRQWLLRPAPTAGLHHLARAFRGMSDRWFASVPGAHLAQPGCMRCLVGGRNRIRVRPSVPPLYHRPSFCPSPLTLTSSPGAGIFDLGRCA